MTFLIIIGGIALAAAGIILAVFIVRKYNRRQTELHKREFARLQVLSDMGCVRNDLVRALKNLENSQRPDLCEYGQTIQGTVESALIEAQKLLFEKDIPAAQAKIKEAHSLPFRLMSAINRE